MFALCGDDYDGMHVLPYGLPVFSSADSCTLGVKKSCKANHVRVP